jgi:uncharacterized protein YdaU (DUF1376 family)
MPLYIGRYRPDTTYPVAAQHSAYPLIDHALLAAGGAVRRAASPYRLRVDREWRAVIRAFRCQGWRHKRMIVSARS